MFDQRPTFRFAKENLKEIPQEPGVYIFLNSKSKPIYIGKSTNLRKRVESYLAVQLAPKTKRMVKDSEQFLFIKVTSEIESLILEANLIKRFQPKYNSELKDDKHPIYIKITKEEYPRIVTARKVDKDLHGTFFGPFPSSQSVRSVLRLLRRIFPYADHIPTKRACLYNQIGLCNPCPSNIEQTLDESTKSDLKATYRMNIRMIKGVLSGKVDSVKRQLTKDMQDLAGEELYEEARIVRSKIKSLEYITQPVTPVASFLKNPNFIDDIHASEIADLRQLLLPYFSFKSLSRIECFDVAHLGGSQPTASMVTFIDGEADKALYRHFRIRQKKGSDDISSLKEIARRRANYLEKWGSPHLIIVDGGKGQVGVFRDYIGKYGIPVIGLAKRFETFVIPVVEDEKGKFKEIRIPRGPARNLVQRIRNEAHRFARRYHHYLIRKNLLAG